MLDIRARGVDYNFVYILGRGFFYILDLSVSIIYDFTGVFLSLVLLLIDSSSFVDSFYFELMGELCLIEIIIYSSFFYVLGPFLKRLTSLLIGLTSLFKIGLSDFSLVLAS
jgi:hypothetical protein